MVAGEVRAPTDRAPGWDDWPGVRRVRACSGIAQGGDSVWRYRRGQDTNSEEEVDA